MDGTEKRMEGIKERERRRAEEEKGYEKARGNGWRKNQREV